MSKVLIDEQLGEVLNRYEDDEYLIVYDSKKVENKRLKGILFYKLSINSIGFFVNVDIKESVKITFFKLITLLELNKGEILLFNGKCANLKTISDMLDINKRTLYNHLKVLEKYRIVKKIKNGKDTNIAINPYFLMFGENYQGVESKFFRDSIWVSLIKKNRR